jgi:hypothetical protein
MSEFMQVFLDLTPNSPKTERTRESLGYALRQKFEHALPEAVERIWELPPVILQNPEGEYVGLLVEARELFVVGHFYSCVAMCGIVGERLVKDLLRATVLVHSARGAESPSEAAFDQFERVDINAIVGFLNRTGALDDSAEKAARSLAELRNRYAHARGKDPHKDAIRAIEQLHAIVAATVSVFKDFEITNAGFAPKAVPPHT